MVMKTFRVRALVNGQMRRSWGESVDAEAARQEASEQLAKVTRNFKIVSIEEVESIQADAECLVGQALDPDCIQID